MGCDGGVMGWVWGEGMEGGMGGVSMVWEGVQMEEEKGRKRKGMV